MISVNNTDLRCESLCLVWLTSAGYRLIKCVMVGINSTYFLVVVFIFHRKFYSLLKIVPLQNINDFTYSWICYLPFTIFKRLFYLRGSKRKGGGSEPLENSNLLNSFSKFTEDVSDPLDTPSPSDKNNSSPLPPRKKNFLIRAYIILDQGISNGHSKP